MSASRRDFLEAAAAAAFLVACKAKDPLLAEDSASSADESSPERAQEPETWEPAEAMDANSFLSRPAPRVARGVEVLRAILHGPTPPPAHEAVRVDESASPT